MNTFMYLQALCIIKTGKINAFKNLDLIKLFTNSDSNPIENILLVESKEDVEITKNLSNILPQMTLYLDSQKLYEHSQLLKTEINTINEKIKVSVNESEYFNKLKIKKEKEINLLNTLSKNNGIIKPIFNIWGSLSGRIITHSPSTQNFPEYLKSYLLPLNHNDNIYELDIITAEVIALAYLTQEDKIFQLLKAGSDIYIYIALQLFDLNLDDITPEIRKISKKIVNGFNLGMGAYTLAEMLYKLGYITSLDISVAKQLKNKYFSLFPNIKLFQDKLKEVNELTTCFGHKFNVKPSYKHIAFPAQNLIASLLKLIIIDLDTIDLWKHTINIVHDSIWISCDEDTMLKIKQIMENRLSEILPEDFKNLPNFEMIKINLLKKGGK